VFQLGGDGPPASSGTSPGPARGAAGMHDPLGDALVIEAGDLLPEVEVLQQGRAVLREFLPL
jgi:hypothetical protein